ncbi:glycoside hydrolase family 26 protein [Gordonia rhizosphera]|nr:glycosyl hydrolase [Gordonia rhizosphera]
MDSTRRPARNRWSRRDVLRLMSVGPLLVLPACTAEEPTSTVGTQRAWGAFIPSVTPAPGSTRSPIEQLATLAGAPPRYLHRFAAIGDSVPITDLDAIADYGATPLLTLEPWTAGLGVDQPRYALARIAAGDFDADLTRWGTELASWNKPVLLRFAQEMNGTWYPWSIGVNGNTAADYRAAWTRMRSVILSAGATNVQFVWAPNVLTLGTSGFTAAYPGHDQVDYLGLDGYNWGDVPGHRWQSASELFAGSLAALRGLGGDQPILITEVGCAEGLQAEMKAQWIRDFFGIVESEPRVDGFLWFQMDKERDWRFNSSVASTEAFRTGVAGMSGQP